MRLVSEEISELDAGQAARLMEGRPEGSYTLLDVRQPEEYEAGHLPAAQLMPLAEIEERAGLLDREKPVITYCRSGNRSRAAAVSLKRLGFGEVHSVAGGIAGWQRPVARGWPRVELFSGQEDLTTALNLVFFMERGSEQFYRQGAERARDPGLKRLLGELAAAEVGHMRRIHGRLAAGRQEMPSFEEFAELADSDLIEAALRPEEYFERAEEMAFADERHVLERAMELEALSLDLYRALAAQAGRADVREALLEMCDQERAHLRALAAKLGELAGGGE